MKQRDIEGRMALARMFDVSRETLERLDRYIELLAQWNARINLVSRASVAEAWSRHLLDSVQLLHLAPPTARSWIDLGSGAGLPGLPVAIVAAEKAPELGTTLVESDRRKVAFLQTAKRELELDISIEPRRIEAVPPRPHDVVSARALAPLAPLCDLAYRFKGAGTVFLFPKGETADSELTEARKRWHIQLQRIPSRTSPVASILKIVDLEPRHDA